MTSEENKAIVKRFYSEVWNDFKLPIIDELFDPDYIVHNLPSWRKPGAEGLKEFIADNHRIFPDVHHEIKEILAEGDKVATYITGIGTQKGELNGPAGIVAPTNKTVHWEGIFIHKLQDGKIVEVWGVVDNFSLMQQLGAIPSRG